MFRAYQSSARCTLRISRGLEIWVDAGECRWVAAKAGSRTGQATNSHGRFLRGILESRRLRLCVHFPNHHACILWDKHVRVRELCHIARTVSAMASRRFGRCANRASTMHRSRRFRGLEAKPENKRKQGPPSPVSRLETAKSMSTALMRPFFLAIRRLRSMSEM